MKLYYEVCFGAARSGVEQPYRSGRQLCVRLVHFPRVSLLLSPLVHRLSTAWN
jgi:hypothetical protein